MTIKVSKPAKGLREAIAEVIGRGASVINGMTKGDAQDELEVSRKNWIINGGGGPFVDQRGNSYPYNTDASWDYLMDRWSFYEAGVSAQVSISTTNQPPNSASDSESIVYTADATDATARIYARQVIEDYETLAGQTLTLSAWVKSNTTACRFAPYYDGDYQVGASHSGDGNWEKLEHTFTPSTSTTHVNIILALIGADGSSASITSGDYIEFTNVKLEIGDTATPFESRSYAEELRDCQRYYYRMDDLDDNDVVCALSVHSATDAYGVIPFPVTMRTDPSTAIDDSGSHWEIKSGGSTFSAEISGSAASTHAARIRAVASGMTTGNAGWLISDTANSWIDFDAELP